jgi:hypothetical protein
VRDVTAEWNEITQRTEHLAAITHELRTSLATMKGFITTLLSSHRYWGERERQEFLENIDSSVDKLSQLLENSQEMTRLEIGAINLEQTPTEIAGLVDRVLHHPGLQQHAARFSLDVGDRLPTIEIDARRVEQALRNLLSTMLAFTPGDSKVHIGVRQEDKEIQFNITSRGGGIPEEHLTHIFDRFFQKETNSAEIVKGPSLALYVARGLIAAHGGRIWAETSGGRSTNLFFTLPIEASAPAARPVQRPVGDRKQAPRPTVAQTRFEGAPAMGMAAVRPPRERLKALVVEDDPYMVRLLKINLEGEGYTVVSATRGSTAIELANAEQRPANRRGRLHDQAPQPQGAAGADEHRPAALVDGGGRIAPGAGLPQWRAGHRLRPAPGHRPRQPGQAHADRVQAALYAGDQCGPRPDPRAAFAGRLGAGLRAPDPIPVGQHQPPARQAGDRSQRSGIHHDRAGHRIHDGQDVALGYSPSMSGLETLRAGLFFWSGQPSAVSGQPEAKTTRPRRYFSSCLFPLFALVPVGCVSGWGQGHTVKKRWTRIKRMGHGFSPILL